MDFLNALLAVGRLRFRRVAAIGGLVIASSVGGLGQAGTAWAEPDFRAEASRPTRTTEDSEAVKSEGGTPNLTAPELEPPPRGGRPLRAREPTSRAEILATIEREAKRHGLPAEIAEAVVHTESGFNARAIGADGEIGLMQVLPSTARMMGFAGSLDELAAADTNIRYGVTYLAQAWRLAGRDLCTAVMKYRAGHGESRFSHLSVDYCLKVRARLASRGFAVAGAVPIATFGRPAGDGRCSGRCLAGSRGGPNLAAINNKLSQIAFRVTVLKVPMR
ncbi:transglycosylase SLT domain-containing protein [Bradyrhizobium sp. LHD-71]|uniref:lytic transglycosylase domain-containing protein n=1 Tax=Bradyrhizobium sp. LHD-71 TaxID=3072141 RepID=UPI00280EFFC1|nr:transglycosylase SLT domain-containing protein [Bradyrhizobium sp. LHD-71]MDQ8728082.1 transglycosylase SLT domain-containing protein [Bradyrhizobium sp. LHD-71]